MCVCFVVAFFVCATKATVTDNPEAASVPFDVWIRSNRGLCCPASLEWLPERAWASVWLPVTGIAAVWCNNICNTIIYSQPLTVFLFHLPPFRCPAFVQHQCPLPALRHTLVNLATTTNQHLPSPPRVPCLHRDLHSVQGRAKFCRHVNPARSCVQQQRLLPCRNVFRYVRDFTATCTAVQELAPGQQMHQNLHRYISSRRENKAKKTLTRICRCMSTRMVHLHTYMHPFWMHMCI